MYAYAANNPVKYTDPTGLFNWKTNMIEANDTLANIAEEYNHKNGSCITYEAIANINGISDPNHIEIGNKLSFEGLSYNDISPRGYNPANFKNQELGNSNIIHNKNIILNYDNLSLFESIVNNGGILSFISAELTSQISDLSGISKNLYKLSDKFGYVSVGIDIFQYFDSPTLQNSRNLIVSSIGLKDPFLGIYLSAYINYQDAVNNLLNSTPVRDISSLERGILW